MEAAGVAGEMVILLPKRGSCFLLSKLFFKIDFDSATRFKLFKYFFEQYKNRI
jgi:hypothetical protein